MPKIVIIGSCRFEPYEILAAPNKIPGAWDTEKGYQVACKRFYPAIDEADFVILYAPDGVGEHTERPKLCHGEGEESLQTGGNMTDEMAIRLLFLCFGFLFGTLFGGWRDNYIKSKMRRYRKEMLEK